MPIGERIRFFRLKRGMTQKSLGIKVGFPESNAEVRMAQYEGNARKPRAALASKMADVLGVSPRALHVPDDSSALSVLHTLFALEDSFGLRIAVDSRSVSFSVDSSAGDKAAELAELVGEWGKVACRLDRGDITKREYDNWRYSRE